MPVTPRNMADSAKTKIVTYQIADLAAGADIADIPFLRCPTDITVTEIGIIPEAARAGIDAANTSVFLVKVGATTITTKTYNNVTLFPAKGVYDSLGNISNADRLEGDVMTLSITNGATADTPAGTLQVEYIINENV